MKTPRAARWRAPSFQHVHETVRVPARAFTLIELMVVIAIVALLLSALAGPAARAWRASREIKCQVHLKQIVDAGQVYMSDSQSYPFGLERLELPAQTLSCPLNTSEAPAGWRAPEGQTWQSVSSYEMILPTPQGLPSNNSLRALINANEQKPRHRQIPFANDTRQGTPSKPWHRHGGYNAVFLDGSIRIWDGVINGEGE